MAKLTDSNVKSLKGKKGKRFEPVALGGSLLARGLTHKVQYYYQYWHDGKKYQYPFGEYSLNGDKTGSGESTAYSLVGARARALKLAALQQEHGDLIAFMREQRAAATTSIKKARKDREDREQEARDYSLANLCKAYWKHLEAEGKPSARDVRNGLHRWVIKKQPALSSKKASDVTTDDILVILRKIIDAGHTTTTNRVRSYLSAAYTFGLGSTTDPLASSRAGGFRLTSNPVAPVKRVKRFERAGTRTLSKAELGEVVRRLGGRSNSAAKAALLSLRLGGQRITQLLRVTPSDYNCDNNTITILDTKGRRTEPRIHLLPVVSAVEPLLSKALLDPHPVRKGLYQGLTMETVSKLVRKVSKEMEENGTEPFSWRDLRRTCETMSAAMGVSKDTRGQIQSHGLGGVQDRHYDMYEYLKEKRAALEAWNRLLDELIKGEPMTDNVVSISHG